MLKKPEKNQKEKVNSLNVFLNKNLKLIKILIAVIMFVLILIVLVMPKYSAVKQEKISLFQERANELAGLEEYTQGLAGLEKTLTEFKSKHSQNIKDLSQLLPSEAEIPNLMAQLESVVQSSGFSLSNLTITEGSLEAKKTPVKQTAAEQPNDTALPASTKSSDNSDEQPETESLIKVVTVGMNIDGGDYFNLKILLDNLEKHLRIIDVKGISFAGESTASQIILLLNTYYFVQ